jgi:hypothetical protein
MCENCFNSEYERFVDEKTNSNIENKISALLSRQEFELISNNSSKKIHENYSVYKCNSCNQIWCFSSADLYWRGFLLKRTNLSSFYERLSKKQKRIKRNGILSLILITIIGIYLISKT